MLNLKKISIVIKNENELEELLQLLKYLNFKTDIKSSALYLYPTNIVFVNGKFEFHNSSYEKKDFSVIKKMFDRKEKFKRLIK